MAYATTNPPALLLAQPGGTFKMFYYSSSDAAATVDTTSYFSDGQSHGMRVRDLILVQDTTTGLLTSHLVQSLSTSSKGVDVTNGTTIGKSSDTD